MAGVVELPKPVLDLLSVHGPVRLITGEGRNSVNACLAPIHEALDAMVPVSSVVIQDVMVDGRAEFIAEDKARDYLIRVKVRVAPGRSLPSEPRWSELRHWAPDGVNPVNLTVLHLYPYFLEYTRVAGGERQRAMGEIPGAALPSRLVVWWELAFRHLWVWLPVALALDWGWLLFRRDEDFARWVLLGLAGVAAVLLVAACGLLGEWTAYLRWRDGTGQVARGRIADGWAGLAEVKRGAQIAAAAGVGVALLAGVIGGVDLLMWVVVTSGAPVLAVVHGLRHYFRRSDATEGVRS